MRRRSFVYAVTAVCFCHMYDGHGIQVERQSDMLLQMIYAFGVQY